MTNPIDQSEALKALLPTVNKLLNTNATSWDELVDAILPPKLNTIRRLGVMYEQEMLLSLGAKAYFAACVMSASMLEAFLLLLCMLNPGTVATTTRYKDRVGKSVDDFDGIICRLGLEDFVEISAELNWVPDSLIDEGWKTALPADIRELFALRYRNMSKSKIEAHASSAARNPAYSLMLLLNMMRNKMHPGKWIRQNHELQSQEAFSTWAHVALFAAAHIRDCLLLQHQAAMVEYCKGLMLARIKIP
ncbi:MAG TPA: hypothetical protein VF532_15145 [Candidatus Angelobacter sp.]